MSQRLTSITLLRFFFFKQKTAYEMQRGLVGSEMCIRDRYQRRVHGLPQIKINSVGQDNNFRNEENISNEYQLVSSHYSPLLQIPQKYPKPLTKKSRVENQQLSGPILNHHKKYVYPIKKESLSFIEPSSSAWTDKTKTQCLEPYQDNNSKLKLFLLKKVRRFPAIKRNSETQNINVIAQLSDYYGIRRGSVALLGRNLSHQSVDFVKKLNNPHSGVLQKIAFIQQFKMANNIYFHSVYS
eukprot:TRINITY_DN23421_c0_g1_i2.p1 TRINITY_DN23421_c0_g1~~TRINITY_DN23421_c0_g1_i2.p1  ORF type:complete len:240 (+),score=39.05 TRINITY_DN23421_c0_g1_i2:19-738(+)